MAATLLLPIAKVFGWTQLSTSTILLIMFSPLIVGLTVAIVVGVPIVVGMLLMTLVSI
jgi:hypothetical protein